MLKLGKRLKRMIAIGLVAVASLPGSVVNAEKLPFPEVLSPMDAQTVAYGEILGKEYFTAISYGTVTSVANGEETVGTYFSTCEGKINGDWQTEYGRPIGNGQFFNMPPEHYAFNDNLNYFTLTAYKDSEGSFKTIKTDNPTKILMHNLMGFEEYIKMATLKDGSGEGSCSASGSDERFKNHLCYVYEYKDSIPYGERQIVIFLDKKTGLMAELHMVDTQNFEGPNGYKLITDRQYFYEYPDYIEKPEIFKDYYVKDDTKVERQLVPAESKKESNVTVDKTTKSVEKKEVSFKVKGHKIKNNKLTLKKGEKVKLKVLNTTDKATFKAKGKSISINKKGKITAKKKGKSKITVKVGKTKYVIKVTVK